MGLGPAIAWGIETLATAAPIVGVGVGIHSAVQASKGIDLPKPAAMPPKTESPEAEKARLDMQERMKRVKAGRAQSRLTLPNMFGEGETKKPILADVLG